MPLPTTLSFDVEVVNPTYAEFTYRGTDEYTDYTSVAKFHNASESPIPNGVKKHYQYGLGPWRKRGETEVFSFDRPGVIASLVAYYENYALAAMFSEDLVRRDLYGTKEKVVKDIGAGFALRRSIDIATAWDDTNVGGVYTTYNGETFMSATHATAGAFGTLRTNILPVVTSLSYQGLQDALTQRAAQLSDTGWNKPLKTKKLMLLTGTSQTMTALKILHEMSVLNPTSNTNDANIVKGFDLQHFEYPFLASAGWWLVDPDRMPFEFWDDQALTPNTQADPNTYGMKCDARASWAIFAGEWEGINGSGVV